MVVQDLSKLCAHYRNLRTAVANKHTYLHATREKGWGSKNRHPFFTARFTALVGSAANRRPLARFRLGACRNALGADQRTCPSRHRSCRYRNPLACPTFGEVIL